MSSIIKYFLVIFTLIISTACVHDGALLLDVPINEISEKLDTDIPQLMRKYDVVGLSVSVIRDEGISILKSYGYSDIESNELINEHTVFRAASLGKPILRI